MPRSSSTGQLPHEPLTRALEGVLRSTRACHASALRYDDTRSRLVVAAVAGSPLLELGSEVHPDDLDEALSAVDDTLTVPLRCGDGSVAGLLHVAWPDGEQAPADRTALGTVEWHLRHLTSALLAEGIRLTGAVVAHEDELVADGLARRLERRWPVTVTTCSTLGQLQRTVGEGTPTDVVLLSDTLAPGRPLPDVAAPVRDACPDARLVVVTRTATPLSIREAQAAAAEGIVALDTGAPELLQVVDAVGRGQTAVPPVAAVPDRRLSPRELQLLHGLDEGLTYQAIATRLGVSLSTAKTQSRSLFRKLDVTSRGAAVHRARAEGLL